MGSLVPRCYPTVLFAKLADHTYVECGTGAVGWACWGGKSGGRTLGMGQASTVRAGKIAGYKERAGIKCYLVNGVCHQAANRILFPAFMTTQGARGYFVSVSLFGVYGRESAALGLCKAPFDQHDSVTGDLAPCAGPIASAPTRSAPVDPGERLFLERSIELARRQQAISDGAKEDAQALRDIQVEMFAELVRWRLGGEFLQTEKHQELIEIRRQIEDEQIEIDEKMARNPRISGAGIELAAEKNALAENFQKRVADVLDDREYHRLLDTAKEDTIWVGDTSIAKDAYERPDRNEPPENAS